MISIAGCVCSGASCEGRRSEDGSIRSWMISITLFPAAWGGGGEEMKPGSAFLARLEEGPDPNHWVEALTIRTPLDLTVVPNSGGTLPGMGDRMVCCPTHLGLQDHEETFWIVRDFLLTGRRGGDEVVPLSERK